MPEHALPAGIQPYDKTMVLAALGALEEKTAISGTFRALTSDSLRDHGVDAAIDLILGNKTHVYLVECKPRVDRKIQIDQVRRQLESTGTAGLLIAPYVSRELADHCRITGLQFIDTCGNAFLRSPAFLVFVTGEKHGGSQALLRAPKGLTSAAALRVVFVLLSKPEMINAPIKDISSHAGVSLGTAFNVLEDLERRGYLINKKSSKNRILLEKRRLMDEWVLNYPTTLRTKLNGRRFTAPDHDWWKDTHLDAFDIAWGSEVAAKTMTGYLKPGTQTLYVQPDQVEAVIRLLVKRHRLKPDLDGEIDILEKFWPWPQDTLPAVAPPLLVYSELLAILDPRTQETANMIKEKFIDSTFDQG